MPIFNAKISYSQFSIIVWRLRKYHEYRQNDFQGCALRNAKSKFRMPSDIFYPMTLYKTLSDFNVSLFTI